MIACLACEKLYSNKHNLRKHHERQPLCVDWIAMKTASTTAGPGGGLTDYVDGKFRLPVDNVSGADADPNTCGVCMCTFANSGNLNRHLATNIMCSKWAMYKDLKPLECYLSVRSAAAAASATAFDYGGNSGVALPPEGTGAGAGAGTVGSMSMHEAFEAPKHRVIHIIWNLFLLDKELKAVDEIVRDNNIKYVIAILKDESEYDAKMGSLGLPHRVITYAGNDAEPLSDETCREFDEQCRAIEVYRSSSAKDGPRVCVGVFCNNGYQRSLPFLCYYLLKFHPNEASTVEKAIDLILPQVDRENYAKHRDAFVASVKVVLRGRAP
jgi:hypothetical protein